MKKALLFLAAIALLLSGCGAKQLDTEPADASSAPDPVQAAVTQPAVEDAEVPLDELPAPPAVEETEPTVTVSGIDVPIRDDIDANRFTEGDFVTGEDGRITCTAQDALLGVDVSEWQGSINWNKVAADGVSFAVIRVGWRGNTEGGISEDLRWKTNLSGARAAGLQCGVYFYSQAVTAEEGIEEAEYVLSLLNGQELDLPVYYDWEHVKDTDARTTDISVENCTAAAVAFADTVEAAGYQACIYANRYVGYLLYDLGELEKYPLWFACYYNWPDFDYDFEYWQYTNEGTVDGISGQVDLNLYLPRDLTPDKPQRAGEPVAK